MAIKPRLLDHQQSDIEFICDNRRVLLANEPGCGKSRSALEATSGGRVLVIAPSMVIVGGTWDEEIKRWGTDASSYTVAPYSMLNARNGNKPVKAVRPEFRGPWDAVIVDEAHYTKGRKTTWTWATEQICQTADVVVEMTGTPIPNWAHELYPVLRVLYPGAAARGQSLGSFWRWAETWFDTTPTRFSGGNPVVGELKKCTDRCLTRPASDPCAHYREFTRMNLGSRYRRVLREDCLDLPPLTTSVISTPMDASTRKIYRSMAKDYAATVGGAEIVSWSTGARSVALDRITTSPWILNPVGEPHGGKFDRLRFDLEGRTSSTLVLAHYNATVEACAQVARSAGHAVAYINGSTSHAQDAASVAGFKAGAVSVLCASLEKVAEGLTLTVADMAIFVETSFKPYRNTQATYRVHRLGQTKPVTILDYCTPKSVDAGKRKLLATKADRQMRYLTAAEFLSAV